MHAELQTSFRETYKFCPESIQLSNIDEIGADQRKFWRRD